MNTLKNASMCPKWEFFKSQFSIQQNVLTRSKFSSIHKYEKEIQIEYYHWIFFFSYTRIKMVGVRYASWLLGKITHSFYEENLKFSSTYLFLFYVYSAMYAISFFTDGKKNKQKIKSCNNELKKIRERRKVHKCGYCSKAFITPLSLRSVSK